MTMTQVEMDMAKLHLSGYCEPEIVDRFFAYAKEHRSIETMLCRMCESYSMSKQMEILKLLEDEICRLLQ